MINQLSQLIITPTNILTKILCSGRLDNNKGVSLINYVFSYAVTTWQKETNLPVIGFDMGGTSTDVSRFAGHYEHVYESTTAGVTIQSPQLDINTVAAGGGSMLFLR